jgi:hypothetical protein
MTLAQVSRPCRTAGGLIDMRVLGYILVELKPWLSLHDDAIDQPRYRPILLLSVRPMQVSNLGHDIVS